VLSCLTDYITCASQNELFDTFRKKNDRNALPGLLIRLGSQWVRFFHKLGQYGKLTFNALNTAYHVEKNILFYILRTGLDAKARFLSFNRTQSRVFTDLLTRHNTLRRHLYLMGLSDSPLCRRCGAEDETSAYILCECEALASFRHVYLGSFFLEPEGIKSISLGAVWNLSNITGLS
jgi:hypothetical protein